MTRQFKSILFETQNSKFCVVCDKNCRFYKRCKFEFFGSKNCPRPRSEFFYEVPACGFIMLTQAQAKMTESRIMRNERVD